MGPAIVFALLWPLLLSLHISFFLYRTLIFHVLILNFWYLGLVQVYMILYYYWKIIKTMIVLLFCVLIILFVKAFATVLPSCLICACVNYTQYHISSICSMSFQATFHCLLIIFVSVEIVIFMFDLNFFKQFDWS